MNEIKTHADARDVLAHVNGTSPTGATLYVRQPVTTYRELLAKLTAMSHQDLQASVTAQFDLQATYLSKPMARLTHVELQVGETPEQNKTLLRLASDDLVLPRSANIALQICKVLNIEIVEVEGKWMFSDTNGPNHSRPVYEDQAEAATTAVRKHFAKSDWKYEVTNDDTHLGYFEWALNLAWQLVEQDQ